MKKLLLITFLVLNSFVTISQEWFPIGGKWTYSDFNSLGPYYSVLPTYFIVEKDTVVLGKSCKKINTISNNWCYSYPHNSFRYADSNQVFYLNQGWDNTWNLLYDFNKQVGDTIFYPQFGQVISSNYDTSNFYVVIDSTFSWVINSDTLKGYIGSQVEFCVGCGAFGVYAVEVLSGGTALWEGGDSFDCDLLGLRCYEDSILGLVKAPYFNSDCDTSFSNVGLKDPTQKIKIAKVNPNPAKDYLNVQLLNNERNKASFDIYDSRGMKVKTLNLGQEQRIEISELKEGIYFYQIILDQELQRGKFIKQ